MSYSPLAPHFPDQLTCYAYQCYGRTVYTQQVTRRLSVSIFTTIISPVDPTQPATITRTNEDGITRIRHEFIPSRFGEAPDTLFITCPDPCSVLSYEGLLSFSGPHSATFTTVQPSHYGAQYTPLPPESPPAHSEPCQSPDPYQRPGSPPSRRRSPGPLPSIAQPSIRRTSHPSRQKKHSKRRHSFGGGDTTGAPQLSSTPTSYGRDYTYHPRP